MRIGIYAPFNRTETSAMAARVASNARREGWHVSWLAPTRSTPAHCCWDNEVRVADDERLRHWAKNTHARIWFGFDAGRYRAVRAAAVHEYDVLVPIWHSLQPSDLFWGSMFDHVAFATRPMLDKVHNLMSTSKGTHGICSWPHGVRTQLRSGPRSGRLDQLSALMHVDPFTMRHHGSQVLKAAGRLLAEVPTLSRLSLSLDTALDRGERRELDQLMETYGDRLAAGLRLRNDQMLVQLQRHDWLIHAPVQSTAGLLVTQARALGVPSVAWSVSPLKGIIFEEPGRRDGVLVPCDKRTSITGAETAIWDTDALVTYTRAALADPLLLIKLQTYGFKRAEHEGDELGFRDYWRNLMGMVRTTA